MSETRGKFAWLRALRTVLTLIVLAVFIWGMLDIAEMSTSGCDDGCDGDGWTGDPNAEQWDRQLSYARAAAVLMVLTAASWLARKTWLALPLGVLSVTMLGLWYSIVMHARFGI